MYVNEIKDTSHRFSDVAGEPCTLLTPIEGFSTARLVPLEEACAPLINIVPRLSTYVYIAKERAVNPANNLSADESASIALYTMEWTPYTDSLYFILNDTLRREDRQKLKPWFLYLKLIFTGLSRLPSISLTVYRGVRYDAENEYKQYQIGAELTWWGFSSCSKSRNVSEKDQFTGENDQRTLFIIDCITGKDISKHSYYKKEQEILLSPATTVKVISNDYQKHGLHVIRLEEIKTKLNLLEPVYPKEEITPVKELPIPNKKIPSPQASAVERERYFNPKLDEQIARYKSCLPAYLIGTRFNETDVEVIVQQLIIVKKCSELFLRESGVTSQGAIVISDALFNNNTLERLFIAHNKIGDRGTKAIAKSLSGNNNVTLKQLNLSDNGITDEGVEYLAAMLESNKTLTHLWLSSNEITDRGLRRLAEVLTNTNKTLESLSLEWNKFRSDSSVDILVDMLNTNKSLTTLNLNQFKLSKSAITHLKTVAKSKKKFRLLIN